MDELFRDCIRCALRFEAIADYPMFEELSRGRNGQTSASIRSGFGICCCTETLT